MQIKRVLFFILIGYLFIFTACTDEEPPPPPATPTTSRAEAAEKPTAVAEKPTAVAEKPTAVAERPTETANVSPTLENTTAPTNTPQPAIQLTSTPTPDSLDQATLPPATNHNPTFEQIVNLGIPLGNATQPRQLTFDSNNGRLYIASQGLSRLQTGNGLSVYDPLAAEFTVYTTLAGNHDLVDLQLDATTNLLYVLREGQFGTPLPFNLTILNSQSLQIVQELAETQAMATMPGQLYTANLTALSSHRVAGQALLPQNQISLPPTSKIRRLLVNPATNRLYLARQGDGGWGVDIYTADTLTPLNTFLSQDQILTLLLNPTSQEILVIENQAGTRVVQRLNADGQALGPVSALDHGYGREDLALTPDGTALLVSSTTIPNPAAPDSFDTLAGLVRFNTTAFIPEQSLLLPTPFEDIVVDGTGNQAFVLSAFDNLLYLIDLTDNTIQTIPTAIEVRDVLIEPASGDLFVSDSSRRVRRFTADFALLAETRLQGDAQTAIFPPNAGQLTLDSTRNRLYVSGQPTTILSADTLALQDFIDPGGQVTLEPGGDTIYLSHCGLTPLDTETLTSQPLLPNSGPREDGLSPNPCVISSQLDARNQRLYALADNGVPGSNSGNILYVYDMGAEPSQIYTGTILSARQVIPDPTQQRAFIRHTLPGGNSGLLRTLSTTTEPPTYQHQLRGLFGETHYSPTTNHLYTSDGSRLLVIAADTLQVSGEMPLPANYDYRVVAVSPEGRIYLAGLDGKLLIAQDIIAQDEKGTTLAENQAAMSAAGVSFEQPDHTPNGPVRELATLSSGEIVALIETFDENSQVEPHLFSTMDQGQTWRDLSQSLPASLALQALAVTPEDTILIAHSGGIYRSVDLGQSWQAAQQGLRDLNVTQLTVSDHPTPALLFAHTLHAGLHLSRDQGQSWIVLQPLDPTLITPPNANQVAASTSDFILASHSVDSSPGKLYRAGPEAASWTLTLNESLSQLAIAPDEQTVLAFGRTLWRSTDGGQHWEPGGAGLSNLDVLSLAKIIFSPTFSTDQTAYLFFQDIRGERSGRLFRSVDGGQHWQAWDNPPHSQRFTTVTLLAADTLLFGTAEGQITALDPADFLWADTTWPAMPFPLDDLAVSPTFSRDMTLFAVSQAHGLFKSSDGGLQWQILDFPVRSYSLDAYHLALSPTFADDQTLYLATGFSLYRSTDGGQSWQHLHPASPDDPFDIKHLALSPTFATDQTLLAASDEVVFRSTDGGDTWQQVFTRPDEAGEPRVLAFSPTSGLAYLWLDYATTLFSSADGGQQWEAHPDPTSEPFAVVTGVIGPNDTLLLRPDFAPQFFQVGNQGQLRQALTDVIPTDFGSIQSLTATAEGTLLAGGTGGLLRSSDAGQSWQSLNAGLPINPNIKHVRAADRQIFVTLADGIILHSSDAGNSWQEISVVR